MLREITTQEFKKEIFDFTQSTTFKLKGDKPIIIMFSGAWCSPCKMVTPILEELQEEYKDKIDIFKVDIDNEYEIAQTFKIRSIPSMLFAPIDRESQISIGIKSKKDLEKTIHEVLRI